MKTRLSLFALFMSVLFAGTTLGVTPEGKATETRDTEKKAAAITQDQHKVLSVHSLLGHDISNNNDQTLGEVQNVLIDTEDGKIAYVIVETGDLFASDLKVIPYQALDVTEDKVLLDMEKEKLAEAPTFSGEMTIEEFDSRSAEFFGVSPHWGMEVTE